MKSIKVSEFIAELQALPESRKAFVKARCEWLDKEMVMAILENHWEHCDIEEIPSVFDSNGYVVGRSKGKYFLTQGQSITQSNNTTS